jgi:hypothetical protein
MRLAQLQVPKPWFIPPQLWARERTPLSGMRRGIVRQGDDEARVTGERANPTTTGKPCGTEPQPTRRRATFVIVSVNGAVFSVISTKSSAERRPQEVRQHPSTPQPSAEKADRPSHRQMPYSRAEACSIMRSRWDRSVCLIEQTSGERGPPGPAYSAAFRISG